MRRVLAVLALVALAVGGYWFDHRPLSETARLRHVLPVVASLRATVYRNQDWCKCFAYPGGYFMESSHESTCALFTARAGPFSAPARRDFDRIRAALAQARADVLWVTVTYRSDGSVEEAEFALGGWGRRSYLFHPGYGQ